jgi:hypothetical protein
MPPISWLWVNKVPKALGKQICGVDRLLFTVYR